MKFRIWINEDNFKQPRNFDRDAHTPLELFGALMDSEGPVWAIDVKYGPEEQEWDTAAITPPVGEGVICIDVKEWADPDYVERLAVGAWELSQELARKTTR